MKWPASSHRLLRRFRPDVSGVTAVMFGLVLVPLLAKLGLAIDFARAYSARSNLQQAADAAALATASAITFGYENAEQIAQDTFAANLKQGFPGAAVPKITIQDDGVIVSVDTSLPTVIMGIIGDDSMPIGVTSVVNLATIGNAEIVLVLDYSSSMNSKGKYQTMRDAAVDLVETLTKGGKNDKISFGLVPFARHVYVTLPSDYVAEEKPGGTWTDCTMDREYPYNRQDTTPVVSDNATKWQPVVDPKKSKDKDAEKKNLKHTNNDCWNYPARDLFVRPLTTNHNATLSQLKAMYPYSGTHIALGLEMGWHVISPNPPYSEGIPYGDDETIKVIVLLTDGRQSVGGNGPGDSNNVSHAQKNLEASCEAIKAQEVEIVTIGFDLYDSKTLERLKNCASKPSYFFDAKTNSDLASAFKSIVGQINGELRLTH